MNETYVCKRLRDAIVKASAGYPMRHNGITTPGCPDMSVTRERGDYWLEVKVIKTQDFQKALKRIIKNQPQQLARALEIARTSTRCRYVIADARRGKINALLVYLPSAFMIKDDVVPLLSAYETFETFALALKEGKL